MACDSLQVFLQSGIGIDLEIRRGIDVRQEGQLQLGNSFQLFLQRAQIAIGTNLHPEWEVVIAVGFDPILLIEVVFNEIDAWVF